MANDGSNSQSRGGGRTSPPFARPPVLPMRLTIMFPCWNEADHVGPMVRAALDAGGSVVDDPARDLEVLVVDDGSIDQTPAIAAALATEHPGVRHIRHERNLGYGAALRSGFLAASMPWVFYTDGDAQFDLGELPRVVALLRERGDAWIVSGYRSPRRDPWPRVLAGRAWTAAANALYGLRVRDVDGAFKIYPRALFDHIVMRSSGALIDAEVLARATALGCRIAQVPVTHRARLSGSATGLAPRTVWRGAREVIALTRDIKAGPMGAGPMGRAEAILPSPAARGVAAPADRARSTHDRSE